MEEEEELRVWEAFSGAAKNPPALDSSAEVNPNPASDPSKASDAAGGNADALDKDRPQKWQRADGKGNARPGGHRNRFEGDSAKRQKGWTGWEQQQAWYHESTVDTARMQTLLSMLTRLRLRHEDTINMWRLECSYVLFLRTGIPGF